MSTRPHFKSVTPTGPAAARRLTLCLHAALVMFAPFGIAAASGAESARAQPESGVLEEVVVSAERRESTVQRTPISLTAFTNADLQAQGITGLLGAAQQAPGISFRSSGSGQTEFTMRGLTSAGGFSPTVGFYLDDVPLTAPAQAFQGKVVIDPNLYDLDRVEMLRGPQGTLYGSGSMGGTIKLVAKAPRTTGFEASGQAIGSITHGGDGNAAVNAMLNVPLKEDQLAVRLVGSYAKTGGWIDRIVLNPFPPERDGGATRADVESASPQEILRAVNSRESTSGRISLLWQPTDRLKLLPMMMHQRTTQDGADTIDVPPGSSYAHYQPYDIAEPFRDEFTLFSLSGSYDWDFATLSSSTARWYRRQRQDQDISEIMKLLFGFPAYDIADGGVGPGSITATDDTSQFSQELRLTSNGTSAWQWIVGAFYSDMHSNTQFDSIYAGFAPAFGTDVLSVIRQPIQVKQKALFGEVSYQIAPSLKATIGLRRYSYTSAETTIQSGLATAAGGPGTVVLSTSDSNSGLNPKFNLSYSVNDDVMVYGTIAKGFRPGAGNQQVPIGGPLDCLNGSGNLQDLGLTGVPPRFAPDTVWSYELGEKARMFDRRVTVNAAAYYQRWNKVQQQITLSCGFGFTDNAGTAEVYGTEVEIVAAVTPALTLSQSLAYTNASFIEVRPGTGATVGEQLLNVPKWTTSSTIAYRRPISASLSFTARATGSYVGEHDDITFTRNRLPGYFVSSARAGIEVDRWSLVLFADNLADRRVQLTNNNAFSANIPQINRVAVMQPRTIGLDLSVRF